MSALVDYPSSESDPEETSPSSPEQISTLPPLPSTFHTLYSTNTRISTRDDPSLHGGRKRQVPHIQGNWPTHVYLEWRPTPTESASLTRLLDLFSSDRPSDQKLHSLLHSDLAAPLPLHISLSRSLHIPSDARDVFLERVTHAVRAAPALREFEVSVDRLLWAANYDQSRWFFALGVARLERDELNGLLAACNRAAGECGYPLLYDTVVEGERLAEPVDAVGGQHLDRSECFHFSLAWSLTSPNGHEDDEDEVVTKQQLESLWAHPEIAPVGCIKVKFQEVFVKIGNKIHTIELRR